MLLIPFLLFLSQPSWAFAQSPGTSASLLSGKYSIGYKKLAISPPYVWYWGWDYGNCNPETLLNIRGQVCVNSQPNPDPFQYGPFGGYLIGGNQIGADGYPLVSGLLDYLEQAEGMRISEDTPGKPVWLTGPIFATSDGKSYVSPSVALECTPNYTANIPVWSAQTAPYLKWLEETAKAIKTHPNLQYITITHGIDGEGYFIRYADCERVLREKMAADPSFPNPLAGVNEYVSAITNAYYRNFCIGSYDETRQICNGTIKPIFAQKTTWTDNAGKLGQFMPPMGIKFSGFTADTPGSVIYKRYWRGWGLIEGFIRYRNLIPTAIEPRYGNGLLGGEQGTYWFDLQTLWMRPTAIDINPSYGLFGTVKDDPDYFDLMNRHLNVNAATTPDVWIAFRDTDDLCGATTQEDYDNNICVSKAGDGSGIRGDYDFFLRRPDNLPLNKTVVMSRTGFNKALYDREIPAGAQDHKYAKYVRRTDRANGNYYMSLDVDNDYPWAGKPGQIFEISLSYLDLGIGDFFLEYKNSRGILMRKAIARGDSKNWKTVKVMIEDAYLNDNLGLRPDGNGEPGYTDLRIFNGGSGKPDVYLHMIKVKGLGAKPAGQKQPTEILCQTPNTSVLAGEFPGIVAILKDASGKTISNRNIRYTIDPYWYTNRISYAPTDNQGRATANLNFSDLPALSSERFIHEIEVAFPGDDLFYGSKTMCYLPTHSPQIARRTISASLSKSTIKVGDDLTVNVAVAGGGGGPFCAEGEGFGLPACSGNLDAQGKGSCTFKIGGMAIAGERVVGVYASANGNLGGASIHLPLMVLDDSVEVPDPITPPVPSAPVNFTVVGSE